MFRKKPLEAFSSTGGVESASASADPLSINHMYDPRVTVSRAGQGIKDGLAKVLRMMRPADKGGKQRINEDAVAEAKMYQSYSVGMRGAVECGLLGALSRHCDVPVSLTTEERDHLFPAESQSLENDLMDARISAAQTLGFSNFEELKQFFFVQYADRFSLALFRNHLEADPEELVIPRAELELTVEQIIEMAVESIGSHPEGSARQIFDGIFEKKVGKTSAETS